jgi:hypothetical protein
MNIQRITTVAITCYYLTLATLVSVKIVETVFSGSILIGKGAKVSQLKQEKQTLLQTKQRLEEELASAQSLANVDQNQLAAYSPIATPIVLEVPSTVALR